MFTGIVEEMGNVREIRQSGRSLALTVAAEKVTADLHIGDSVAVSGVCLTVVQFASGWFTADVMPETYQRTTLRHLRPGDPVNLERSMAAGGRFGGHLVQGHVDGVGTVLARERDEIAWRLTIGAPPEVMRYVVPKGSIAVDGVSLTVVDAAPDRFSVSIIPHTAAVTTLGHRQPGDPVNLEADLIAKYVEKFLSMRLFSPPGQPQASPAPHPSSPPGITYEFLARHGFAP